MSDIKLYPRYPHSRQEDITDAYTQGVVCGIEFAEVEIKKLRNLVAQLLRCPTHLDDCAKCEHVKVTPKSVTGNWDKYECSLADIAQELGIEDE